MKKSVSLLLTACAAASVTASPLVVCDFENYEAGDKISMWNKYNDSHSSVATVEIDPSNPANKVLHVTLKDWNTYVELQIPGELTGKEITDRYQTVECDLFRSDSDENDYKQFWVLVGDEAVYNDESYPHQGDKGKWQHRSYALSPLSETSTSSMLHIGLHSDKSDYYIDNIVLKGAYDDFVTIADGLLDICTDNTDKNYAVHTTPIMIPKSNPLTVRTSRYTEFRSDIVGDGDLNMYCGGERTFVGTKDGASYPDWSEYTGDLHIYPYTEVKKGCGFYGVILNAGGKTFNPEDIKGSLENTNRQLINNRVYVHDGATLATPNGNRAVRIGELNTAEGSRLCGTMRAAKNNSGYLVIGYSGTNATLAGKIAPVDKSGQPFTDAKVGIVKEGTGIYRITGNNNLINGSVRVCEGKVMLNNDISAARTGKLGGAIGALGASVPGMYVFTGAAIGGIGHSASIIDLYGDLEPGDNGIGTLTLADFEKSSDVAIRLRPTSRLHFEISSATSHDHLEVNGPVDYWNIREDFAESDKTPIIYIEPTSDNSLKAGDHITLIKAKSKTSRNDVAWNFRVQYPKCYTWEVSESSANGSYIVTATVISLEYTGQGDVIIDDSGSQTDPGDDDDDDDFDEATDSTPLRKYAQDLKKNIGVATPCWSYDLTDDNVTQTAIIGREFNMLVSENGHKFDATEPSRNVFDYTLGDRVTSLAARHNATVRGHTFAWHKQVAGWVTSNGEKNTNNFSREELLEILKNHIFNVAAHYKGKIAEWDVVNECLSDNQTAIRSNPDAYDLRPSVWYTGIGEDFIDYAFKWAHEAAPDAKLYLTDYGVEFKGIAKTEALFNLAKRLVNAGIPIHGVGLQCHFDAGNVDASKLAATIESYEKLGLECIITELDLGISSTSPENLKQQAKDYAAIAKVWLTHDNCPTMMIWGLVDSDSWRQSNPLLFDSSLKPKPAYYSVHRALRLAAKQSGITNITDDAPNEAELICTDYYNLQGQRVTKPDKGITIIVKRFSDGSITSEKVFIR